MLKSQLPRGFCEEVTLLGVTWTPLPDITSAQCLHLEFSGSTTLNNGYLLFISHPKGLRDLGKLMSETCPFHEGTLGIGSVQKESGSWRIQTGGLECIAVA